MRWKAFLEAPIRGTLRLRVAAGFALLGVCVSLLLGGWLYLASRDLAQRVIDEALSAELEDYLARLARNPASLPPRTATVAGSLVRPGEADAALPSELEGLGEGRHSVRSQGVLYRVAVHDGPRGMLYMLHDQTRMERREGRFAWILVLGVAVTALLSAAGGWWLAGRVIAPVRELAARVRQRDPGDPAVPAPEGLPRDELGELAQIIERHVTRLRAFAERERAFASDASHELRTPLAVIRGTVELLASDPALDDRRRERLDRIARAARGMTDLTEALLSLAREEAGVGAAPSPCRVDEVAAEVVDLNRPLLRHKPVQLSLAIEAHPALRVERSLLAIALGNLLRNACAYTESGEVRVTVEAHGVRVEDTGPGIPEAELACLFDDCADGRRTVRGAGIGLPLVKRIADRMGWGVAVESRQAQGAVFRLRFAEPVAGPAEASAGGFNGGITGS